MNPRPRVLAAAIRLILFSTLVASDSAAGGGLANLTGTWKLNKDLSDDPRQKMKEAQDSGGSGGGGLGRHRGGFGGRRRGSDTDTGAESPRSSLEENASALQLLKIQHQEPQLVIEDGIGRQHKLFTDGRKVEEERSQGGTTEMRAVWKDARIVVTTEPEKGPKITETYAVAADGSQLTVTSKIEGRRGRAIEIRRVYDAVKPAVTPAAPTPPPAASGDESIGTGERLGSTMSDLT
jgi:hypothetical protein